ncbi:condensation domain-containing protein [Saccharopolyspora gregorii]|uniref:condensation domain-containing protein n=1 Tax=Saccharopolyspora gregorii TaxID=33914 RepID=UPI0021ACF656|nr:condensation domain-containing protein [Saccharopolyspora gregorii]
MTGGDDQRVRDRLVELLGHRLVTAEFDPATALWQQGVDSLDLIRLARSAEIEFAARIALRELLDPDLTLDALVRTVRAREGTAGGAGGELLGPVVFAPSQEHAWDMQRGGRDHWNQSLLFRTRPAVRGATLRTAVRGLVVRHQSLRLRVEDRPGQRPRQTSWDAEDGDRDAVFHQVDVTGLGERRAGEQVLRRAEREQRELDLAAGRTFRCVFFDAGDAPGWLLVTAHQLTVDLMSWPIILADLEHLAAAAEAGAEPALPGEGTSALRWAAAVAEYARTPGAEAELPWWTGVLDTPAAVPLDFPHDDPHRANTGATAEIHVERFTREQTGRLLTTAVGGERVPPATVLLHALGEVLATWCGTDRFRLDVLRHGRDEDLAPVDLGRTTGWFTVSVPVRLSRAGGLIGTRDHLDGMPHGGVGYGALRHHGRPRPSGRLRSAARSDVSFDYEGDEDALPIGEVLIDVADEQPTGITAADWSRPHLIEVLAMISDGELRVEWWYSRALHVPATIRRLAAEHRRRACRPETSPEPHRSER